MADKVPRRTPLQNGVGSPFPVRMDQKLAEAEFFFNLMLQSAEAEDFQALNYLTSAFLSSIKSITDVALEDANIMFELQIPDEVQNIRHEFKLKANISHIPALVDFHGKWEKARRKIDDDRFVRFRHIAIHRKCLDINEDRIPFEVTPGLARRPYYIASPPFFMLEDGIFVRYEYKINGLRGDVFEHSLRLIDVSNKFIKKMIKSLPSTGSAVL